MADGVAPATGEKEPGRRYLLADHRAAALLAFLDSRAERLGAEGHLEQTFEHLLTRVTLRFTVGHDFGELEVHGQDGLTSEARVYAAGPIERILRAIGFREVARQLAVSRRYQFHGAVIRVAHAKPLGWFCEIRPAPPGDSTALSDLIAAARGAHPSFDAAGWGAGSPGGERRILERRIVERRTSSQGTVREERRTHERRTGDRRLALPA